MKKTKGQKGFTLIEILVVIGIIAILAAVVLIAINPAKQFSQANNTSRRNGVLAILNAIHQYGADNKGALPSGVTTTAQTIGSGTGEANICSDLVTKYLAALPRDPSVTGGDIADCSATHTTGYQVVKSDTDNRVTVSAPSAELSETISGTR